MPNQRGNLLIPIAVVVVIVLGFVGVLFGLGIIKPSTFFSSTKVEETMTLPTENSPKKEETTSSAQNYQNPFDDKVTYLNPFATPQPEYQNPFDNL